MMQGGSTPSVSIDVLKAAARAHATAVRDDVLGNIQTWRDTTLGGTRSLLTEWFAAQRNPAALDDPVLLEERATVLADQIIEQWCLLRAFFTRVFIQTLEPGTVEAVHGAGQAAELGRLIGQFIDEATRDLDTELREMIEDATARLGIG